MCFKRVTMALVAVLVMAWALPAAALETNLEQILLTLNAKDPESNPDTDDVDENGIVDRAHTRLLERVLQREDAPNHALILAIYTLNLIRLNQDNTLTFQCTLFQRLYGLTCDDLEAVGAGLITTAEPAGIDAAIEALKDFGLNLNRNNYNLTGEQYLAAAGDLDGDGYTNLQEYTSVCGDFEQFVTAAMDRELTPETLPCCVNCPLVITTQPEDAAKYVGEAHVFTVAVSGVEGDATYEWFKDGGKLDGESSDRLNLGALKFSDIGVYHCVVSDPTESVTSRSASLNVAERIDITAQPTSAVRLVGQSHQFSTTATGGLGALSYQWRKGESNVGANAPVLSFGALEAIDAGSYNVVVSDSKESLTSNSAILTVLPRLIITSAPEGAKKYVGDSVVLSITTEGGLVFPPLYNWKKDGMPLGVDAPELLLDPLEATSAGNYLCEVSDGVDTLTSAVARVQVVPHLAITRQPEGASITEGTPITLRVEVSGGYAPLFYQWFKQGEPIDVTRPRLVLDAATLADSGVYTVTISDGTELVTSEAAELVVNPVLPEGEGVVEGVEEGMVEGSSEGVTEGITEGVVEGILEGAPEGVLEGSVEGTPEGVSEGNPEGLAEGIVEGIVEGAPEGSLEGIAEGVAEGITEGSLEGVIEGLTEGILEGEGAIEGEGVAEGEGIVEGDGEGNAEGILEGEGMADGEGEGEGSDGKLISLPAAKDVTLYERSDGSLANGAGAHFFVGRNASNEERRGLLAFDMSTALPSRVVIRSAVLRLHLSRTNASQDVALHAVTRAWEEGPSDAPGEEGAGAATEVGDVTWLHTFFDDALWQTPGGDFEETPLLVQNVPGTGEHEFSSEALVALVQAWADQPASNYGILLRSVSPGAGTAQRFDSRENAAASQQPQLVVVYEELPPEGEVDGEGGGEGSIEGEGGTEGAVEGLLEGEGISEGEGAGEGEGEGEGEDPDTGAAAESLLNAFDEIDLNGDRRLTYDEAKQELPDLDAEMFDALDADGDGEISLRELRDFLNKPQGNLSISATVMDFGRVATNVDKEVTLYIENTGNAPLSLRLSVAGDATFSLATLSSLTIAPGVRVNSRVHFVPPAVDAYEGTLYLDTRDGVPLTEVALRGEGLVLATGGCFANPEGPGGIDLELILLVVLGLAVVTISIGRMNTPE
jgi:hypothetical protein